MFRPLSPNYSHYSTESGGHRSIHKKSNENSDLQAILERERKRGKENRQKMEALAENEKKQRLLMEDKLLKLKQEISTKDRNLSEAKYRLDSMAGEFRNYQTENQRLKSQLFSLKEAYEYKLLQLTQQLEHQEQQNRDITEKFTSEFDEFKQQGQSYIEKMEFEYGRKCKQMQQKIRNLEQANKNLQSDRERLNDMLASQQLSYQEQIRSCMNRIRDDETRKYTGNLRGFQARNRANEEAKDTLQRKNQELLRQLQQKQQQLTILATDRVSEISRYQQEISELKDRVQDLRSKLDRSSNEINKVSSFQKPSHDDPFPRQQLEAKKRQISILNDTILNLRQQLQDLQHEHERKSRQLLQKCSFYESECRRYKAQNASIWTNVKHRLNQSISQATTSPSYHF